MLTPGKSLPEVNLFDFQDKFIHLFCFAIQSYLWCGISIKKNGATYKNQKVWINFLVYGILIGILLETTQKFIPTRSFDWMDMIVNVVGGIFGFLGYLKWPSIKFILE
jgi:VanZ family protein